MIINARRILGLIVGLGILYAGISVFYDVGYFNDDASYILAARAIYPVRPLAVSLSRYLAATDRLPGYPVLIAAGLGLVGSHWQWLKFSSILFSLSSLFLLWRWARHQLPEPLSPILLLVVGLNPTFMKYSCSVMAEPGYLFFTLLCLILYQKLGRRPSILRSLLLAFLTGWSLLMRPEGAALFLALFAALVWDRRWSSLACLVSVGLILDAPVVWRQSFSSGRSAGYLAQFIETWPQWTAGSWVWLKNSCRIVFALFAETVPQACFSRTVGSMGWVLSLAIGIFVLVLTLKGWNALRRTNEDEREIARLIAFYIGFYIIQHGAFLAWNSRYVFALIPLIWFLTLRGAAELIPERMSKSTALPLAGMIVFLYVNAWSSPSDKLLFQNQSYRVPHDTYQWIRASTPPPSFFLAIKAESLQLWAERRATSALSDLSPQTLPEDLARHGVTHILVAPSRFIILQGQHFLTMMDLWRSFQSWGDHPPKNVRLLYLNPEEKTAIYQVRLLFEIDRRRKETR